MTKLLHQVFGVWTTGRLFDPDYEAAQDLAETLHMALPFLDAAAKNSHQTKSRKRAGITPPNT